MEINIFASSDVHGFINNYDYAKDEACSNSLATISTIFKNSKAENKIIVDNGDMIQGNFIGNFNEDKIHPAINMMNYIGYSIWNLGNHEFNYGVPNLKNVINQFKNNTLMANSNDNFFKKYSIIEINNLKIGFIGINTPLINKFESKEALGNLIITDPVIELDNILESLKKETDSIIGMFHLGLEDENSELNSGVISIIDNLKDPSAIDAIVCGHTHQKIEEFFYKDILITQPYVYGKNLAQITLNFENKKLINKSSKLIETSQYKPDKFILNYFKDFHKDILSYTHKEIGYIENSDENSNVDLSDSPIAHLITDVMLSFSKADVTAFQIDNSNAILRNGPLTRSDMANLYSYAGGEVSLYEITGRDLKLYMEWSAAYFQKENGKIIVSSDRKKLKYKTFDIFGNIKYNVNSEKSIGDRIENLKYLNNENIKENDKLIIALNEYRMNYLTSETGPLKDKTFEKIKSSKYLDINGHKRGTIRGDLTEDFFKSLKNKTYIVKSHNNFKIK